MFLYCLVLAYRLVFIYNTIHTLLLGLHYVQVYSSPACSLSSRPDLMFVQMHCKCVRNTHTVVWLGYHTGHALPMEVLLDLRGATRRMPRRGRRTAILHASSRGARASTHSNRCMSHSSPPRRQSHCIPDVYTRPREKRTHFTVVLIPKFRITASCYLINVSL